MHINIGRNEINRFRKAEEVKSKGKNIDAIFVFSFQRVNLYALYHNNPVRKVSKIV
jgi:hypothetical protein